MFSGIGSAIGYRNRQSLDEIISRLVYRAHIATGAKSPPCPSQDNAANLLVLRQLVKDFDQASHERRIERIQGFRTVQRHRGDTVVMLQYQEFASIHVYYPPCAPSTLY